MNAQVSFFRERIVDLFAGGGGASTGIEDATGVPVDVAVNHDAAAILMHKKNHPWTEHYQEDVFTVDPMKVTHGQPVGLLWASPDCKHFSKAKGKPLVDKHIRGLSWVVLRWALENPPRVILMENVEEIQTWGPLICVGKDKNGNDQYMPDPARKGETFQAFIGMLSDGVPADHPALTEACEFLQISRYSYEAMRLIHGLGYKVEYRELVAADYGAPTTRKRWVLCARRDGAPIVWPERTHAPKDSEEVKSGKLLPWRGADEIIDWEVPMYSIFATRKEIKEKYGVNAVRPLADNTLQRVIKGVDKHTIRSGNPFIVPTGYGERPGQAPRVHDINAPLPTIVGKGKMNLVDPVLAPFVAQDKFQNAAQSIKRPLSTITSVGAHEVVSQVLAPWTITNTSNSIGSPADKPVHTVTSGGNQILAAAHLVQCNHAGGDRFQVPDDPLPTISSHHAFGVAAANLVQYHTEKDGEEARTADPREALATVDGANRHAVVSAQLTEYYGNGNPIDPRDPMHTVTGHDREALTAAFLQPFHAGGYKGRGNSPEEPVNTVTATGSQSLVAAHIVKFKGKDLGQRPEDPLQTITAGAGIHRACSGGTFAVAGCQIVKYEPGADLGYWPKVRALLNEYCGYSLQEDEVLLIWVAGAWRYIRDILLRMLTPRELYRAQGFHEDYIIEMIDPTTGKPYSKADQVARVGNSVSPPMAEAMVRANLPEWCGKRFHSMAELRKEMAV